MSNFNDLKLDRFKVIWSRTVIVTSASAKILRGMPHFVENHAVTYLCHLCDFMMGLIGKPELCTKLEIADQHQTYFFFWVGFYDDLANPSSISNLKSLSSAVR